MNMFTRLITFLFLLLNGSANSLWSSDDTHDFCIAIRIKPPQLRKTLLESRSPIHSFLPASLMLERLDNTQIQELTLLIAPSTAANNDTVRDPGTQLNMALLIRCSNEIQIESLLKKWPNSNSLEVRKLPSADSVRIENHDCAKLPAGSFLPVKRKFGVLGFLDRNGKPVTKGMNVGFEYDYRTFVEGNSPGRAIYTFENLEKEHLNGGTLKLGLRQQVFRTHTLPVDKIKTFAQVLPGKRRLLSKPLAIATKSYVTQKFVVPKSPVVVDKSNETRKGNLWQDLVDSKKQLSIAIFGNQPGVYHGFGEQSLSIELPTSEYVFVDKNQLIVTQSESTLGYLINNKKSALEWLQSIDGAIGSEDPDSAFQCVANIPEETQRRAFANALRYFNIRNLIPKNLNRLRGLRISLNGSGERLRGDLKFNEVSAARSFQNALATGWSNSWKKFASEFRDRIIRRQVAAKLASIGFSGISFAYPDSESELKEANEHLKTFSNQWIDSLKLEDKENQLSLDWSRPAFFATEDEQKVTAIALLEESTSEFHYSRENFDKSFSLANLATARRPNEVGLALRMAHQHSFNESVHFMAYEHRYAYIRLGILGLLEYAERNKDLDAASTAAFFIAAKLGRAEESEKLLRHFSKDQQLQDAISKLVGNKIRQLDDSRMNGLKITLQIVESSIEKHRSKLAKLDRVPEWLVYTQPFLLATDLAMITDRNGMFENSLAAWKNVKASLGQLGQMDIPVDDGKTIRLNSTKGNRSEQDGNDERLAGLARSIRDQVGFDYWIQRCEFELSDPGRACRKAEYKLRQIDSGDDLQQELGLCEIYIDHLLEFNKADPKSFRLVAGEFKEIAKRIRRTAATLEKNISAERKSILLLIDESKPTQRSVLGTIWTSPLSFE